MPGLLSAAQLDRATIDRLIRSADGFASGAQSPRHEGALVGLMFYEDSLRTRTGFDAAAARLGARTTTLWGGKHTPHMSSAETLEDAVRSVATWFDLLCLRHPAANAPERAASAASTPVINCGNGTEEHPTQALVDLYAIKCLVGRIDGLRMAVVGDLKHMRSAHSLLHVVAPCSDWRIRLVAPDAFAAPGDVVDRVCVRHAVEVTDVMDVDDVDIVYVAGFAAKSPTGDASEALRMRYRLEVAHVVRLGPKTRILCPLPRVDEIAPEVDVTRQAAYFEQSALAIWMRMAILDAVLAGTLVRQ